MSLRTDSPYLFELHFCNPETLCWFPPPLPFLDLMAFYNFLCLTLLIASACTVAHCKLSPKYYSSTCPKSLSIVKSTVIAAIKKETRIGASLLRLHFHDCFVNGCDGSILLDDTANFTGEKMAAPNNNSARGFNVVDKIKAGLEKECPGVVSCADILALAARDSVEYLGGPSWTVELGRRDSTTASLAAANSSIPAPTLNLSALISNFKGHGLSVKDLVALSGSHTIGLARCTSFRSRIYNDSNIDASFAKLRRSKCPKSGSNNSLANLDAVSPTHFDNYYYKNLLGGKGLLHSDQELYNGSSRTDYLVKRYVHEPSVFFSDFAEAMIKMGNIKPLTGIKGEVRLNCRKVN
ncbi:peroxidase P7-like [Macadamia integrifolia]|uniref:peroxidase P7-like n=1 Tax=Macadamia integrifolia TaxID=60698 RepID=UPI001C4FBB6E|nr:peroxidase P7-like [Macadamia integrifolia]